MKKFITLMLVFLLAFGCVAGCGEDEVQKETDGNNTTKALTITDVTNTIAKMSEGAKFDFTFILNVKPIFDENSFSMDLFISELETQDTSASISQMGFVFEVKVENQKIGEITAPENILTEEELNALLTLFGIYDDGSDPNGDPSDYESF